jgi:hypothetical protein
LRKKKQKKDKKESKEIDKRFRRQKKIEREVEGYIDNLFKNEMEKRADQFRKISLSKLKSSKDINARTLQNINDEMMSTGMSRKPKFISNNTKNAKKAIERYEKDQYTPGASTTNVLRKSSVKR